MIQSQTWRTASQLSIPFVFTVIVRTEGSTPRKRGSFIIHNKDANYGSIGGGAIELKALALAKRQLEDEQAFNSFTLELDGDSELTKLGVCGGKVHFHSYYLKENPFAQAAKLSHQGQSFTIDYDKKISFESSCGINYPATPQLMIFGGGHCGKALVQAANLLGYRCHVIDDVDFCKQVDDYPNGTLFSEEDLKGLIWGEINCAILLTRSWKKDIAILRKLQNHPCTYIGMMGSRKRIKHVKEGFLEKAGSEDFVDSIHSPVGLNLNAESPEEIAISILAEIIQVIKK